MSISVQEAIGRFGVEIDEHLDRQAAIPFLSGLQRQGDVLVRPTRKSAKVGTPIPADGGVPVVRGENGGNTHCLVGEGTWSPTSGDLLVLGVVDVSGDCFLAHPEHGYLGLAPGSYIISRQREQADEIRRVAD